MSLPSVRYRSEILLRALAVSFVVLNHAYGDEKYPNLDLAGGMPFLLMLSGYALARFALDSETAQAARLAILRLVRGIALPTLGLIAFYACVHRTFDLREFLFIKNWFVDEGIADFPRWYPQVIIQLLLITWAALWLPGAHGLLLRRPLLVCATLLAGAMLLATRFHPVSLTPARWAGLDLPQGSAWNFILGWLVFFLTQTSAEQASVVRRIAATACVVVSAYLCLDPVALPFWWLSIASEIMIWTPTVRLPEILGRPPSIVSQATFAVFLLHVTMFKVFTRLAPEAPWIKAVFAIAASVAVWIVIVAAIRAYRCVAATRSKGLAVAAG